MQTTPSRDATLPAALLLLALVMLTALVYSPGLKGGWLFDDYPNLEQLGSHGGVRSFETFRMFVFGGDSGPTGRPISLASFLLDDFTWPTEPAGFKRTNLLVHLLNGLLLSLATFRLLLLTRHTPKVASMVAVISAGIWLLHPYMLSTTLYVVQRMAQLATLFTFAGLAAYLHGRILLDNRSDRLGYFWMSCGIGLGTLLATFSKENGALLPVLVLVIEFSLASRLPTPPKRLWLLAFVWAPSAAIFFYLASKLNFSPDIWPNRPFNQKERLLTETRIIFDYLSNLYIPRIEGNGLFQDGIEISRSFTKPITTLICSISLLAILFASIKIRNRLPFLTLAILFFLTGHLIESTLLGLELHFEHRNYAPAAFLFLPLAQATFSLNRTFSQKLGVACTAAILISLALLTYQRATLWENTAKLETYWAANNPQSPRAQNAIANVLINTGRAEESIAFLEQASQRLPDSGLLSLRLLAHRVYTNSAKPEHFQEAAKRAATQPFDAQTLFTLRRITEMLREKAKKHPSYIDGTIGLIEGMGSNPAYRRYPIFVRLKHYLLAKAHLLKGDRETALLEYREAAKRYANTEAALAMTTELAESGATAEALVLLSDAKSIFLRQPQNTMKRSPETYKKEIERFELVLKHKEGSTNPTNKQPRRDD